jgi:hypothetical protein
VEDGDEQPEERPEEHHDVPRSPLGESQHALKPNDKDRNCNQLGGSSLFEPAYEAPEVTVFLLDYLREKVGDEQLRREINATKDHVLKQVGPPKQSPIEVPSQSAK